MQTEIQMLNKIYDTDAFFQIKARLIEDHNLKRIIYVWDKTNELSSNLELLSEKEIQILKSNNTIVDLLELYKVLDLEDYQLQREVARIQHQSYVLFDQNELDISLFYSTLYFAYQAYAVAK